MTTIAEDLLKLRAWKLHEAKRANEEASHRASTQTAVRKAAEAKAAVEAERAREEAEAAKAEQRRQERAEARREAARRDAIINSRYAKDDPVYAIELASQTDMTSAEAIERLREHAAAKRARSWKRAMARAQNRPWDVAGEEPSSESSWDRAMAKVQGR